VLACGVLYVVGVYLRGQGDPAADLVLAVASLASASLILSPAQYPAVAAGRPLVDAALAAADAALGVHVPALAAWTRGHPLLSSLLTAAYFSLLPQLVLTPAVLVWYRRHDRLREYLFHFHLCAGVTVAMLALFPAACAFQYYGFESVLDQRRFIAQFNALRAGAPPVIGFGDLEGLISVPSFHAAGGLMCAWAVRGLRPAAASLALNAALLAATVMTGAHYLVDVPVTAALFATSVAAWRLLARRTPS